MSCSSRLGTFRAGVSVADGVVVLAGFLLSPADVATFRDLEGHGISGGFEALKYSCVMDPNTSIVLLALE